MRNYLLKGLLVPTVLLLHACSTVEGPKSTSPIKPTENKPAESSSDGPPEVDLDVTHIPNAVPQIEPISRYGNPAYYEVFGQRYKTMSDSLGYEAEGIASWYGSKFHGQRTSSGEPYDMYAMTAAHRSLPLPTYAKITNVKNGKEVIVKINDRGPFVKNRLIDLSYAAAKKLGIHSSGTGKVKICAIDPVAWHKEQNTTLASNSKTAKSTTKQPMQVADKSAAASKKLYIQLGAFNKKLNAQQLADKAGILTQALNNVDVHVMPNKLSNKEIYKVRVGPLKDKQQAQKLQKELLALGNSGSAKLIYE